jgi:Leucine-rich repeat (LRR) protein
MENSFFKEEIKLNLNDFQIEEIEEIDVNDFILKDIEYIMENLEKFINLKKFNCRHCCLERLPKLPKSIKELDCSYNIITKIDDDELPPKLEVLYCQYNKLVELPNIPETIITLKCSSSTLLNIHPLYNLIEKTFGIQNFIIIYRKGILLKNDIDDNYYFKILKEFQSENRSLKRLSILGRTLLLEQSARICLNPKRIERLLESKEINFFDGSFETI